MEVHLSPDLEGKLAQIATEQGRNSEALIIEALERMVEYQSWFGEEVAKGLAAADRGEFVEHEEIGRLIKSKYPG